MTENAISLFDLETLKNPYPAYQALRDTHPVYFEAQMNVYVVTRYDLVREAIRDTQTYSSKYDQFLAASQIIVLQQSSPQVQARMGELMAQMIDTPPTMLTLDEPEHTQYRSLVSQLFTASQIRLSQAAVQAVIDETLGNMKPGKVDFIASFADPIPLRIIADRLGIPLADREFFNRAATLAASALRLTPLTGDQLLDRTQVAIDLQKYLVALVDARRAQPENDMITILANSKLEQEDRLLTHGECISVLNQFLVAGHETTSSAFGWGMLALCRNPGLQDQLRGDAKLIKVFVEEVLRLEAPVQGLPRVVTRDTELGGYTLKQGDMIMLRYGAANRDERQFECPNELDVHRVKAGSQLAFGAGVHFCIGAPLARQELSLGFAAVLDAGRNFRLAEGGGVPEAEASFILRSLPRLDVEFDPI